MVFSDIKKGLNQFVERYDSQTYLGSYRETSRSSLLNDGLSTRANSLWKMAEYVVAQYDNNTSTSINDYISGWKTLASNANNQYLIIEETKSAWAMYDAKGNRLGGEEFIQEYFSRMKKIGTKKISLGEMSVHQYPLQQIFYGSPGTGKSHEVKKQTGELSENGDEEDLPNVFRTTFHPDTDYASFVGCYKPTMKPTSKEEKTLTGKDEEIVYEFVPQVFTDAYIYAYKNSDQATYLVIEEINRGNCAQIFGDLFQLLDRKDGKSEYKIKADKDLAQYLREKLGADFEGIQDGKLCLPANLHILATMNTSDQSLFPIDSAFKRRWEWKYVPINNHEDKGYQIEIGDAKYDWWGFLARINHVINDTTNSEDKKLGYFFAKAKDKTIDAEQFVGKVLFYLWNDVFKSYGFDDPIFSKGDNTKFEFSDFFINNGTPNTDTVNLFLRKLEETIKMEKTPMEIKPDSQDNGQGE